MGRPVWLDASGASSRALGVGRGVSPTEIRTLRVRVRQAREEVGRAAEAGELPHERLRTLPLVHTEALRAELPTEAFAVLGEPGALRAHRVLGGATPQAPPRWLEAPLDNNVTVPIVEIPGPAWATTGAHGVAALEAEQVRSLSGVGAPGDFDGRFGVFSPLARALFAHGGGELAPVDEALADLAQACRRPSDDPATGLATWLLACALAPSRPELAIMGGGRAGRILAAWVAGALSAITLGSPAGALARTVGLSPRAVRPGDECQMGWLTAAGTAPWLITIEPGVQGALDPLLATHRHQQQLAGGPVLRLRMSNAHAPTLVSACWLVVEAAVTVAVLLGIPPLTMPEADAFHVLRAGAESDSSSGNA